MALVAGAAANQGEDAASDKPGDDPAIGLFEALASRRSSARPRGQGLLAYRIHGRCSLLRINLCRVSVGGGDLWSLVLWRTDHLALRNLKWLVGDVELHALRWHMGRHHDLEGLA
eukprot:CAMPEP_0206038862 /NCGR_PEP_ID=MMETSP1466-20131121/4382_1 /ASSEMBLY_ACC=CAM_ASM_001126 /TAXON_ID=44452 /ORGANISM="Pavlova gyrans, Strain CCMP608" /LENGTH=114 /DNA_ID=CAMNT_0053413475 /DNA_START=284 /DNA_END=625 /DNA_ORIENTATION=-